MHIVIGAYSEKSLDNIECAKVSPAVFVNVFYFHAGGNNMAEKLCKLSKCDHPRATTWMQCKKCEEWRHCICAVVKHTTAKKQHFTYIYVLVANSLS